MQRSQNEIFEEYAREAPSCLDKFETTASVIEIAFSIWGSVVYTENSFVAIKRRKGSAELSLWIGRVLLCQFDGKEMQNLLRSTRTRLTL